MLGLEEEEGGSGEEEGDDEGEVEEKDEGRSDDPLEEACSREVVEE